MAGIFNHKGLIHIYCGDGKGKTTAAVGLAVRSAGRGFKVLLIQFLKSRDTGELYSLARIPGITIWREQEDFGFTVSMSPEQKSRLRLSQDSLLEKAIALCNLENYDLLILDEAIASYNLFLINRESLLEFLRKKPDRLEVVLTGRDPAWELLELADYVSEIKKVKHPFDRGIKARTGIEK